MTLTDGKTVDYQESLCKTKHQNEDEGSVVITGLNTAHCFSGEMRGKNFQSWHWFGDVGFSMLPVFPGGLDCEQCMTDGCLCWQTGCLQG